MNRNINKILIVLIVLTSPVLLAKVELSRIISDPIIQPHHEFCTKSQAKDISACIWSRLGEEGKQEEIVNKYFKDTSSPPAAQAKPDKSSAIKNLEAFMEKRLSEALYGEIKEKQSGPNVADHAVFYSLFRNQISKNIIVSVSSYCIEAQRDTSASPPIYYLSSDKEKREKQREDNIKSLQNISEAEDGVVSEAYQDWGLCLASLSKVCSQKIESEDEKKEDKEYSKGRACLLTNYLRKLRDSLIIATDVEKAINSNIGGSVRTGQAARIYTGSGDEKTESINDLTSITSNELASKSEYMAGVKKDLSQYDKCLEEKDIEFCKQLLGGAEKNIELEAEVTKFGVASSAYKQKIEGMTKDELALHLEREGRTKDEISRAIASDESYQAVKDEISQNYDAEKQAIIDRLKIRVSEETVKENETDFAAIETKVVKIRKELAESGNGYKQLLHYNNIVSGFLTVADEKDNTRTKNISSIAREMKDSAYDPSNSEDRTPASAATSYFADLASKLGDLVSDKKGKKDESTPIGVEEVNVNILKYDTLKNPEDEEENED